MANVLAQNPTFVSFSGTSASKAFASAGTNPSLYVAAVTTEDIASTITVSDNQNAGNYAADSVGRSPTGSTGEGTAAVLSKQNTSTGTATVSLTINATSPGTLKIFEITGAATSSVVDGTASGGQTNTGTSRTLNLTTAHSNSAVIVCGTNYSPGALTDAGYTASFTENGGVQAYHFGEYIMDAGAAGTKTLNMGDTTTKAGWSMAAASYKFSGAASGPTINTQPSNQTVTVGTQASFTVAATTSGGSLTYQWQRSTDSGGSWNNVSTGSGGTTASYTTDATTINSGTANNGDQYRVQVTDSNGTVNSTAATLFVNAIPIPSFALTSDLYF